MMDSFERLFTMSTFEALRTIRRHRFQQPLTSMVELVRLIRQVDPGSYDYDAAAKLDDILPGSIPHDQPAIFYRSCIEVTIPRQVIWRRTVTLGRRKFTQKLSRDEEQCFRAARLLDDPPSSDVVEWWDKLMMTSRSQTENDKMQRARYAERLSLEHEKRRLVNLGINLIPTWVSIDDNTAGYDILSYDAGEYKPINRLIEVKSTIASPLRFFLTRNEWEIALKFDNRYVFHIWDLKEERLYERTVTAISAHVPTDNERGRWSNSEIPVTV
jgi:hypothetical protein